MGFIHFMASGTGRLARIIAGGVLILGGWLLVQGPARYLIVAIGLVPLAAGLFDICLMAPLFGCPLSGAAIRKQP
ncbi:MAG: hypothetical protein NVS4B8_16920 [Herpetosiphon sp.]